MTPILDFPPVPAISVGPLAFHTWGVFVAIGIGAATALAARRASRAGLTPRTVWDLAFWGALAGIVGARLLYVAEYWRDFAGSPGSVIAIWEGGMSAFGALLAGVPAAWLFARRRRIPLARLAAAVGPTPLLGDAIGRLGGAASHMYPGKPTAFPLAYVLDGVQRHEVGIELAVVSFVGFLTILLAERRWWRGGKGSGQWAVGSRRTDVPPAHCLPARRSLGAVGLPTALTLLWYSSARFLLDFLRASDLPGGDLRYGGLTLAQWLALVAGGVALWALWNGVRSFTRQSS